MKAVPSGGPTDAGRLAWRGARVVLCASALFAALLVDRPTRAAAPTPVPPAPKPAPRALSDEERAAVQWASDYLSRGPEAFAEALSSKSPLKRWGDAAAREEIEVRAGPNAGAAWELRTVVPSLAERVAVFTVSFPSGLDETLVLDLVEENGAVRLHALRTFAEPSRHAVAPAFGRVPALPSAPEKPEAEKPEAERLPATSALVLSSAGFVLGALLLALAALLRARPFAAALSALVAFGTLGAAWMLLRRSDAPDPAAKAAPRAAETGGWARRGDVTRLGALLPLRRALAATEGGDAAALARALPEHGPLADVSRLWLAQQALQTADLKEVRRLLSSFPSPSALPLAELLRARLSVLSSKESDAAIAYERTMNLGPGQDGLFFEAASAFALLGFEERGRTFFRRLARMGSRAADTYYALSGLAAVSGDLDGAETSFRAAWALRPAERKELFESPVLWEFLLRPSVAPLLSLQTAAEPVVTAADGPASASAARRPLKLSAGATASLCGRELRIKVGASDLRVPGAADLAPDGAAIVDAGAARREEEAEALADLPQLTRNARNPGSLTQPRLRRQLVTAAEALAQQNRWSELALLTAALSPTSEHVPPELLVLRGEALRRIRRPEEAAAFLTAAVASPALSRRAGLKTLADLSEVLNAVEAYQPAVRVLEQAYARKKLSVFEDRIRRIRSEAALASGYSKHRTAHFEILFPPRRAEPLAARLGEILEWERTRLLPLVPLESNGVVAVHLLWFEEFRRVYTGGLPILGIFDGKIRIPFAGIPDYRPEIIQVLTHELTHAMLAEATNDRAPHWLHEGIAQFAEMDFSRPNPLVGMPGRMLSVATTDGILNAFPDATLVEDAYEHAFVLVEYMAKKHPGALPRLVSEFRLGRSTEGAISAVFGQTLADFDLKFFDWCRREAPSSFKGRLISYQEYRPTELFPVGVNTKRARRVVGEWDPTRPDPRFWSD